MKRKILLFPEPLVVINAGGGGGGIPSVLGGGEFRMFAQTMGFLSLITKFGALYQHRGVDVSILVETNDEAVLTCCFITA